MVREGYPQTPRRKRTGARSRLASRTSLRWKACARRLRPKGMSRCSHPVAKSKTGFSANTTSHILPEIAGASGGDTQRRRRIERPLPVKTGLPSDTSLCATNHRGVNPALGIYFPATSLSSTRRRPIARFQLHPGGRARGFSSISACNHPEKHKQNHGADN